MRDPICVLKFGSSVLTGEQDFPRVILEIYGEVRRGRRVVAVVSALGGTTDQLLQGARGLWDEPEPSCLARLLETGEAQSAAKLGLALDQAGLPARVLDPVQIGLRTSADFLDAEPLSFDAEVLHQALQKVPVVVVPGFSGRDEQGRCCLLGRGGSDLTALLLAQGLKAQDCRLVKDVDGLLRVHKDGRLDHGTRYATASYDECVRVGAVLVQPKAVEYAAAAGQSFRIASCGSSGGTRVGPLPSEFEPVPERPVTRVALAGLGTVGLGVWRWLQDLGADFQVTSVLVRHGRRARPEDVPDHLLTTSLDALFASEPDLVIEVAGGTDTAASLAVRASRSGIPVITANKQLLAEQPVLLAGPHPARGSASVGGGVPMLETVGRVARQEEVEVVEGIINGTCNFILDRVNAGQSLEAALAEAQLQGLAEADPHQDISGLDSVYKLALLAGAAFGEDLPVGRVVYHGLERATADRVDRSRSQGSELKLVARARRQGQRVVAEVGLRDLPAGHPLAGCPRQTNRLVVTTVSGRQVVTEGKGAGRWPTALSVLGDVLDCRARLGRPAVRRKSA
jgi:homoserine dehydrogenase